MKKHNILSVGMSFCDIPLRPSPADIMERDTAIIDPVEFHSGGDALNVATVLAKLGQDVTFATYLGDDNNGRFIRKELEKNGVRTDFVKMVSGYSTATSYQLIEENGQRHFLVDNRINALLKSRDISDEMIRNSELVFFGSALAMEGMDDRETADLFRRAHALGRLTSMDASVNNPGEEKRRIDLLKESLPHTDIFIPSYEEASFLAEKTDVYEIMEAFRQFPFKVFGIKLGAEGCILTEDFENYIRVEPCRGMDVIDTTGAGDCFMGGFILAYLNGWSLKECAQFGSAVSAFGISAVGSSTAVPDYDTVYRFMQNGYGIRRDLCETIRETVEKRAREKQYTALGYSSNLDLILDFKIERLNELLQKYLPEAALADMRPAKLICTMQELLETIVYFCSNGIGGEADIQAPSLLRDNFSCENAMGGTGVQAAMALSKIGGHSIVHLTDDSKEVCEILKSPCIHMACKDDQLCEAGEVVSHNPPEYHFILQFRKGDLVQLGEQKIRIPCSNRLILTKITVNDSLPFWEPFFRWIETHAEQVSSNVLSSFNSISDLSLLAERLEYVKHHVEIYHQKNPRGIVYFEDAHYHNEKIRRICMDTLYPYVDIMSMNEEELQYTLEKNYGLHVETEDVLSCVEGAELLRKKYRVRRGVVVHTKDYAMFAGDPGGIDIKMGLEIGGVMATAKAAFGGYGGEKEIREIMKLPLSEKGVLAGELLEKSPFKDRVVIVPTHYIDSPSCTIGLGDSFTGGMQLCF